MEETKLESWEVSQCLVLNAWCWVWDRAGIFTGKGTLLPAFWFYTVLWSG